MKNNASNLVALTAALGTLAFAVLLVVELGPLLSRLAG